MPRREQSVVKAAMALALSAIVVGCTSPSNGVTLQTPPSSTLNTPVSSTSTPVVSTSRTPTSVASPSVSVPHSTSGQQSTPQTPGSLSSANTEAADRQAVQSLWERYWTTGSKAIRSTPAQQKKLMSSVAVDPALALVLQGYAKFAENGWTDYGTVNHRPYWSAPIAGKSTAVMGDCMDDSKAGSMDIKTGDKLTVGVPRDNTRVTASKGADGTWRVMKVEYLVKVPC